MSQKQVLKEAKRNIGTAPQKALDLIEGLLETEPDLNAALLIKAIALQRLHRSDESLPLLLKVTKEEPNSTAALRGLTMGYLYSREYRKYLEACEDFLFLLSNSSGQHPQDELDNSARICFNKLRTTIEGNAARKSAHAVNSENAKLLERFLEMQIPPTNSTPPKRKQIYWFLESLSPPVLDPNALSELIYHRQGSLTRSYALIAVKMKQSLNYNAPKAAEDRLKALEASDLEMLLNMKLHSEDDTERRRAAESDLLELLVNKLKDLQGMQATRDVINPVRATIKSLAEGMIMFLPQKPLAYELAWDWNMPSRDIKDYPERFRFPRPKKGSSSKTQSRSSSSEADGDSEDGEQLRKNVDSLSVAEGSDIDPEQLSVVTFQRVFPHTPLGAVIKAFLSPNEPADVRARRFATYDGDCVFAWLLIARFYVAQGFYESAIDASRQGMAKARAKKILVGSDILPTAESEFQLTTAQAYANFQVPKNFGLAFDLYEKILAHEPDNLEALVGKGFMLSRKGENEEAVALLERVVTSNPDDELARAELSWLLVQRNEVERGIEGLQQCVSIKNTPAQNAELSFKIGYAHWIQRDYEACFASFTTSLEYSKNYAPAYTYLGLFFEEVSKDKQRAQRCYYRALELDSGEIIAAEKLAVDFADNSQWDLVEVIATTVLSTAELKGLKDIDWPYRAMGIACLNQLKYDEAVKYFQKCLRSQNVDVQAWVGLGEAYIHSGRYSSAVKALKRALKLEPTNFPALYILSLAQRCVLDFPASSASLGMAIEYAPGYSVALQWALADHSLQAAKYYLSRSMYSDAEAELKQALLAIEGSASHEPTGLFWGQAAETVLLLHDVSYELGTGPSDTSKKLPETLLTHLLKLGSELDIPSGLDLPEMAVQFASKFVDLSNDEPKARRVSAHELAAQAYVAAGKVDEAAKHYQAGIALEPRNEGLWNGYGLLLLEKNPKVSQHCFIRALSLNGRNPDAWVNLSGLYLTVGDPELAIEAVERALSLDPEHPRAWIVQALAETMLNSKSDENVYRSLEYAYTLSSNDKLASFVLALKECEMRLARPTPACLGALTKLLAIEPHHEEGNLIMGLLLERGGDYESSLEHLSVIKAWPHIARVQLSLKRYKDALESCEEVENSESELGSPERLSCLLTAGLALYFLGDFDAAVEKFTEALNTASDIEEEDVLCLLVEVLYASQNADARQVALDQLFGKVEESGPTIQVVLLLAAIGILEQDDSIKDASKEELKALMVPELQGKQLAQACRLLSTLEGSNRCFQRAVYQWPGEYELWRYVDKNQALLLVEGKADDDEVSKALVEAGGFTNSQRSVFMNPCSSSAWEALASSVKTDKVN